MNYIITAYELGDNSSCRITDWGYIFRYLLLRYAKCFGADHETIAVFSHITTDCEEFFVLKHPESDLYNFHTMKQLTLKQEPCMWESSSDCKKTFLLRHIILKMLALFSGFQHCLLILL